MGFFSLAHCGATVRSHAWRIKIPPAAFQGRISVPVEETTAISGTEVRFAIKLHETALQNALSRAARYFPVAVSHNGETLSCRDFLDQSVLTTEWNGIRIGVSAHGRRDRNDDLNFHGISIHADMPWIQNGERVAFQALADIDSAPDLKLVLPARKEAVQNEALAALKERAEKLIYEHIATLGGHRLSFQHWKRAGELGVSLPEAEESLRIWTPSHEQLENTGIEGTAAPKSDSIILVSGDPPAEQTLARALELSAQKFHLLEPLSAYEGYKWYDALPQMAIKTIVMTFGERNITTATVPDDFLPFEPESTRPDHAEIVLGVAMGTRRKRKIIRLRTDLVLSESGYGDLTEAKWTVTKDAQVSVNRCVEYLVAAYFSASDDTDADSYETQPRGLPRRRLQPRPPDPDDLAGVGRGGDVRRTAEDQLEDTTE